MHVLALSPGGYKLRTTRLAGRQAGTEPAGVKRGQIPVSARSLWHYVREAPRCSQTPSVGVTRVNLQGFPTRPLLYYYLRFCGFAEKEEEEKKKKHWLVFLNGILTRTELKRVNRDGFSSSHYYYHYHRKQMSHFLPMFNNILFKPKQMRIGGGGCVRVCDD